MTREQFDAAMPVEFVGSFYDHGVRVRVFVLEPHRVRGARLRPHTLGGGVDEMVGTIEVGKQADIAVFSAHPFAPEAKVEKTLVDGKILFDIDKTSTLRKLIEQQKRTTTTTTEERP